MARLHEAALVDVLPHRLGHIPEVNPYCHHRATVIESGHGLSETWDYGAGDIWYFRPNEGHMIQGLADGCTYLAGTHLAFNPGRQERDFYLPVALKSSRPLNVALCDQ